MRTLHLKTLVTSLLALSTLLAAIAASGQRAPLNGTFIQLNRSYTNKTAEAWVQDMERMRQAGIDTLIVQWCAQDQIAYVTNTISSYAEQLPGVLDTFFDAVKDRGFTVHLGLHNDSAYWQQIRGRDRVVRDYFLVRIAQNERLQKALLARYGGRAEWAGYYIPDEIDDLTWRMPERRTLVRDYISLMTERLRANDAGRLVSVSTFFRGRTAPDIYATNLLNIVCGGPSNQVDAVLVQDGVGVGDPPPSYVSIYFDELNIAWTTNAPALWGVVEAFQQTSKGSEPFAAVPTAPARLQQQVETAATRFQRLVLFTFLDYADPARGPGADALFQALRKMPRAPAASSP